jgi:1,4-alpha-glucan branching enzyme
MWEPIKDSERQMERLVARFGENPDENTRGVLNQTARELLLLEASDWPFLVTTGQAREYAIQRFTQHMERFTELARSIEHGRPDGERAAKLWELDRIFPEIDYRNWAKR